MSSYLFKSELWWIAVMMAFLSRILCWFSVKEIYLQPSKCLYIYIKLLAPLFQNVMMHSLRCVQIFVCVGWSNSSSAIHNSDNELE